jgi:hypothetical protein
MSSWWIGQKSLPGRFLLSCQYIEPGSFSLGASRLAGDRFAELLAESLDDQQLIAGIRQIPIGAEAFTENLEPPSSVLEPDERMVGFAVATHGFNLSPVVWGIRGVQTPGEAVFFIFINRSSRLEAPRSGPIMIGYLSIDSS